MKNLTYNPFDIQKILLYAFIAALAVFAIQACDGDDDDDEPVSPNGNGTNTIVEVAESDSNFTRLVASLETAGLTSTLEGEGPYTVFAPTNAAFDSLPAEFLDTLSNDQLAEILSYHVIDGEVASGDLETEQSVEALDGGELFITTNGEVSVNDSATVTSADIEASNGIIHSIDRVLLPDSYGSIVDLIVKRYSLSSLEQAVRDANLTDTLQQTGVEYTVFAPDNAAFDSLGADTLDSLSEEELQGILAYHVLEGRILSSALSDSQSVATLSGDSLVIEVAEDTVSLTDNSGNTYNVTTADLEASNGVVHIINGVLLRGQQ